MTRVVICIPAYNAEETISRTLDTLVVQDFPIYKIKVFDNNSTDNTVKIIREYEAKYPFIELDINEENLGGEGNFTRCIQHAEGDYTALLHSDDLYETDFISKSVAALEANPGSVATFCGAYEINSNELVTGVRFYPPELQNSDVSVLSLNNLLSLSFKYSNFITCPSVVVKSWVYSEKIKNWNGVVYKTSADLDVWLRLAELGSIIGIQKKLMRYRVAEASYSFRVAKKRITRHDLFLVLDHYKKIYQKKISTSDETNYIFLNLKDQALRSLNIIRNKKREEKFPIEVPFDFLLVIKKMLSSKWHFKFGISVIVIKTLTTVLTFFGWGKSWGK